ncbi:PQQ-binding-like beta-propeller repeat protein [Streptomyces sp. AC558_RSS880]|uniref:serine/threonine-protein kinase n=1 Tax=Streptomyces sp. AC558_RSS880 TaxID=2823687 RepID=UPI001C23DB38|nr:serine/threonine-protein kinase [Streptomyces sp. AC558_RSS880]
MSPVQPLAHDDPDRLGRYRLIGRLGSGGMGTVFLARSSGGRTVALKTVHPRFAAEPEFRIRFRLEAEAARAIGARHGATVVDCDPDGAVPWLATEYLLGPSLDEAVRLAGPLPEHTVRAVGAHLADALGEIHRTGIVHRDLKPSNVLLTAAGPKIIDFGIARALGARRLTATGQVVGTPAYMSPEQATGHDHGPEGDVFALGGVLLFAATGRPPFPGDSAADILYRVRYGEPDLTHVPDGLRPVIASCLRKEAADRPAPSRLSPELGAGGDTFAESLPEAVLADLADRTTRLWDLRPVRSPAPDPGAVARTAPDVSPDAPPLPRRRALFALGGGLLAAGSLTAGVVAYTRQGRQDAGNGERTAADAGAGPPEAAWTFAGTFDNKVRPVAAGGVVLVRDALRPRYTAVDVATGRKKWSRDPLRDVLGADGGLLAVPDEEDGVAGSSPVRPALLRLDPESGRTTPLHDSLGDPALEPTALLTADRRTVYVLAGLRGPGGEPARPFLSAYDLVSGAERWREGLPEKGVGAEPLSAVVEGGRLVCVTRLGLTVRAADTGRTLYSKRLVDPARYDVDEESDLPAPSAAVVRGGRIHVSQGEVLALDARSGETLWRWGAEEPSTWPGGPVYGAPAVQDGVVYVVAAPEDTRGTAEQAAWRLIALDAATGEFRWDHRAPLRLWPGEPLLRGGLALLTPFDERRLLYAVDLRDHKVAWTYSGPAQDTVSHSLAATPGHVYVLRAGALTALPLRE